MPADPKKSGGVYLPEWLWKALQSILLMSVVGAYGMLYSMHGDISELKLERDTYKEKIASLEKEVKESQSSREGIRTSLTKIETELPYIKQGIDDLKSLLTSR
tara:strand:+ start:894 stop:1202 length:309 start_codon:yes stop_codon:yes gene_type:complete